MRSLVLVVLLVACGPRSDRAYSADELALIERTKTKSIAPPAPRPHTDAREVPPVPAATAGAISSVPSLDRCESTRGARVRQAKETITAFTARVKEVTPLMKFAFAHKCELRDTSGSVLVTKTKEAGGTRVAVKRGHEDELVCDTTKIPEGLDVETMRWIALLDATDEDAVMFETIPECDAKEYPSLRVRYNDQKAQAAVLALPD